MIISKTPLRVSFLGGGTDFPDYYNKVIGACISTTIDKYIYVILKKRFDDKIVLHYTKTEVVNSIDEIKHDLIRECLKLSEIEKGIEITTLADIPSEGSGLGSSSTLTVGLLNALYNMRGIDIPTLELADRACKVEIDILKRGIGKQDQYAAAFGGLNMYVFKKDGIQVKRFNRSIRKKLENKFLLFFTGITRPSSEVLDKHKANLNQNTNLLNSMLNLTGRGYKMLESNLYLEFIKSIDENWKIKKQFTGKETNDVIETMYSKAMNAGALSFKVCGAGGGGFVLVGSEVPDRIREALKGYKELRFNFEAQGSKIIYKD